MTQLVLLLLAALWAAFLIPPWLQNRSGSQPTMPRGRSAGMYEGSTLDISRSSRIGQGAPPVHGLAERLFDGERGLGGNSLVDSLMPRSAEAASRRRREVAMALGAVSLLSMVLVPVIGSAAVLAAVVCLGLTGSYGYLVVQRAQRHAERQQKVRPLRSVEVERLAPIRVDQPLRRSV